MRMLNFIFKIINIHVNTFNVNYKNFGNTYCEEFDL